ncbi:MAG: DinB family protein [Deinococcota bacterium]
MTPTDVATLLANTPNSLRQLLATVDDATATWKPSPDAWCINEVIGHLIWADEWAFAKRIEVMIAEYPTGHEVRLEPLDVNAAAAARHDCQKRLADVLDEFTESRAKYVSYVQSLDPKLLNRSASYKHYGLFLASDFLYEWPFHDYGHVQQIMKNLRKRMLPHMSEVMRVALEN